MEKLIENVDDNFIQLSICEELDNRREIINQIKIGWLLIKEEIE